MRISFLIFVVMVALPRPATSQWRFGETVDPISDRRTHFATLQGRGGDELVTRLHGPPYLLLRCEGGFGTLEFETGGTYFNSSPDEIDVVARVDRNEPLAMILRATSEGTGGWTLNVGEAEPLLLELIRQMKAGGSLVLRAWDYRGVAFTYSWSLAGTAVAAARLSCFAD